MNTRTFEKSNIRKVKHDHFIKWHVILGVLPECFAKNVILFWSVLLTVLKTLNLYFISHISILQTPDKNNEVVRKLEQDLELKKLEQTQQRQDYEDLLVLLEDQDSKIKKFKVSILTHSLKCLN